MTMSLGDDKLVSIESNSLAYRRSKACLARPSQSSREEHIQATKLAIDNLIEAAEKQQEGGLKVTNKRPEISFYTPKGSITHHSLEIVHQQNDPLDPPRHRYRKERPFEDGALVLATPETKAPILRPPPAKLTEEEKQQWRIPRSVSNWKNGRGFMIDLNTRSAASKPPPASNDKKQADFNRALMEAEQEVKRERSAEEERTRRQSELRRKLLSQQGQKRSREVQESEDVFDARLFHAGSKARQESYDEPMFGKRGRRKPRRKLEFEQ